MTRKASLEGHLRESSQLINEYQEIIRLSENPKEKARARRAIEEQRALIQGYLAEYLPLCRQLNLPIPQEIAEIAAAADVSLPSPPPSPPPQPTPPPAPTANAEQLANAHALLIGIDAYRHLRPLRTAVADAQDLRDLLAQIGYPAANLALLRDGRATKAAISDKLDWLARRVDPASTVLIFFSGHGARRVGGFEPGEYLCPVEADWHHLRATAISDGELTVALRALPARRVIILLDACHSGGVGAPKEAPGDLRAGLSDTAYERLSGQGRIVLASCKPDQVSWELAGMRNGLFTHYLLRGLRGGAANEQGQVRILNLFDYISRHVSQEAAQQPLFKGELDANLALTPRTKRDYD